MSKVIIKYSDIINRQATLNIGCIGHVAHVKSTVVRGVTGLATQRHKKEQERNCTLNLGYVNYKIWICPTIKELFYTSANIKEN